MNCDAAREAMLVVEPEALNGSRHGTLGRHLAGCAECRAIATALTRDLEILSVAIAGRGRNGGSRARRVALIAIIPAAAALIVAAAALHGRSEQPDPIHAAAANSEKIVSVDIKRGQQATVLRTSDPTVTVVWISQESEP